ncbi:MAG: helix-hairpin-helix domain-containing protein [Anaerolineae bacterium]|nr:helix-hairpin-helix domain-containing protein [Anaerolineae bacterium]
MLTGCNNTPDEIIIETPNAPATRVLRETRPTQRPVNTVAPTATTVPIRPTATPRQTPIPVKININKAGVEGLASLPRIGNVTAERIVQYRQQKGLFRNIDEIKNVAGIGDATFEAIKDRITISD